MDSELGLGIQNHVKEHYFNTHEDSFDSEKGGEFKEEDEDDDFNFNDIGSDIDENTHLSDLAVARKIRAFDYEEVVEIHIRRFLMQVCALEIFCQNSKSFFIIFKASEIERAFNKVSDN